MGDIERQEEYPEVPAELLALLRDPRTQPPITHVAVAKAEMEFLREQLRGAVDVLAKIAQSGEGRSRPSWRATIAREWLEASGYPTAVGRYAVAPRNKQHSEEGS